jgi:hypothetical protein
MFLTYLVLPSLYRTQKTSADTGIDMEDVPQESDLC